MAVKRRKAVARPKSRPAPYGGWNTRDALDAMEPADAIVLENWVPGPGKIVIRKGHASHSDSSSTGNPVQTLVEYHAGSTRKLIGAAGGNLWDFSGVTATSLKSGLSSNRWQTENFNGRLVLVNGSDAPHDYDGTSVTTPTWTGTGLTASNLDGVMAHNGRLYFWDTSKQSFWYGATNAVSGTLTEFPLSRVSQFGGNLLTAGSWTVDSGSGIDDLAVFVMSSGQVIIYSGSDPGDAANWSKVGVYDIGRPIHVRGIVSVGGDLIISTYDDYVSLKKVLRTGYIGSSSKLSGAVQTEAPANGSRDGWQSVLFPTGGLLIFNVPQPTGDYIQHVVNTITGAPCYFTGLKAHCWATYDDGLYFGGDDGIVYQYTGTNDNGAQIPAIAQPAWTDLGVAYRKRVAAIRPILGFFGTAAYELGVGYDFQDPDVSSPSVASDGSLAWDTFTWESWEWGGSEVISTSWQAGSGSGDTVSPRLRVNAKSEVSWIRTDYRIEPGSAL